MAEIVIPDYIRDCLAGGSEELLNLAAALNVEGSLRANHFYALRDWLESSGYAGREGLAGAVLLLMQSEEEGSLCLELSKENLERRLATLVDQEGARKWLKDITHNLESGDCDQLVGSSVRDHRPLVRISFQGRDFLYFQKLLRHEMAFVECLQKRLASRERRGSSQTTMLTAGVKPAALEETLGFRPTLPLDADQRRALELALKEPFAIISGGPGTGKTALVVTLLRCLVRRGVQPERIALAAPTGRAAQRLIDALHASLAGLNEPADAALREVRAGTLHQLLEYWPSANLFRRHVENPVEADLVIVDEVSMAGLILLSHLLQALSAETKLILLGDKDQLPSVEAGAVLSHLVAAQADRQSALGDCIALLGHNHRSQAGIREAAAAINEQDATSVDQFESVSLFEICQKPETLPKLEQEGGCRVLDISAPAELRGLLTIWGDRAYGSNEFKALVAKCQLTGDAEEKASELADLFAILERKRILTLVRDGPWGCVEVNRFLQHRLHDSFGPLGAGDPVLLTRNDPVRGLFNGDVGLALHGRSGLRVVFARRGSFVSFAAETLSGYEFGYALTVHKSQGSEYGSVLLLLPAEGARRLLTKELIYTGITRAKDFALICGPKSVLASAVARKVEREAGLLATCGLASG